MPASRAAASTSPLSTAPDRMAANAPAFMVISPAATASRRVLGLELTSTMRTRPRGSRCVARDRRRRAGPPRLITTSSRLLPIQKPARRPLQILGPVHVQEDLLPPERLELLPVDDPHPDRAQESVHRAIASALVPLDRRQAGDGVGGAEDLELARRARHDGVVALRLVDQETQKPGGDERQIAGERHGTPRPADLESVMQGEERPAPPLEPGPRLLVDAPATPRPRFRPRRADDQRLPARFAHTIDRPLQERPSAEEQVRLVATHPEAPSSGEDQAGPHARQDSTGGGAAAAPEPGSGADRTAATILGRARRCRCRRR